jgi:hypothetical protein
MTAHELAQYLLKQPDYPVFINGWGSDEGNVREGTTSGIAEDGSIGFKRFDHPIIYLNYEA